MPWGNQSGGNSQGPRGPWGGAPSGGGNRPPELEDMWRRAQSWLRDMWPSEGWTIGTIVLIAVAVIGLWLLTGLYFVSTHEQGVVLRFGKFQTLTGPGPNYHLPWPIETVQLPEVTTTHQINIGYQQVGEGDEPHNEDVEGESLMLTGDENIVDVNFTVYWVINNAAQYLFNVEKPDDAIKAVAESAMREVVGQNQIGPILTEDRGPVENQVRELMQKTLASYRIGVTVTGVKMQNVDTPVQVRDAYRDVQAARADQERMRNEAEGYANKIIPEARGNAAQIVQQAEAYRQKTIAEASGEAKKFDSVLAEYRKAPEITRKRMYIETMSQVYAGVNKVIVDENAAKNIIPYLPPQAMGRPPTESVTVTAPPAASVTATENNAGNNSNNGGGP
ncbi:MAG TPA: FtsH protease activity modulator HflK [Rhizomicrobium sp.]|nr:FtsH protease activity modulator HflK [Rhizomicrobium sp.]